MASLATEKAPDGSFTNAAELTGRVTTMQLVKGQPVLKALLADAGANGGLQALVPPGMRAITIEVNEFQSVAGLLTPGSREPSWSRHQSRISAFPIPASTSSIPAARSNNWFRRGAR